MPKVQPIRHPWDRWEDHVAGIYASPKDLTAETAAAHDLLADPERLEPAMKAAIAAWPQAAEHQLTNMEQNRRAWVGWAACRHAVGATALATRAAWPTLTEAQRDAANGCADRAIHEWEETHTDEPTLFL